MCTVRFTDHLKPSQVKLVYIYGTPLRTCLQAYSYGMERSGGAATLIVATGTAMAIAVWWWRRQNQEVKMSRRFIVLASPAQPAEALADIVRRSPSTVSSSGFPGALRGACANAARETELAGPFTHAALLSFPNERARSTAEPLASYAPELQVSAALELDFTPTATLICSTLPAQPLRHIFFAKFKPGAPIEELIAGYSGLPAKIPQMRAFEYGRRCCPPLPPTPQLFASSHVVRRIPCCRGASFWPLQAASRLV